MIEDCKSIPDRLQATKTKNAAKVVTLAASHQKTQNRNGGIPFSRNS
jgi:hypothetical protein